MQPNRFKVRTFYDCHVSVVCPRRVDFAEKALWGCDSVDTHTRNEGGEPAGSGAVSVLQASPPIMGWLRGSG